MFAARATLETLEKPVFEKDETGFSRETFQEREAIRVCLLEKSQADYNTNELDLSQVECVGYTTDARPCLGWRIGGKWLVQSVTKGRTCNALLLTSFGGKHGRG